MASQDPLSNLADIHLPGAVSIWPPAVGWWLVAGIIIALLVLARQRYLQNWIKHQRLSAAMAELDKVYQQYQRQSLISINQNQAGLVFLQGINNILRRVAMFMPAAKEALTPVSALNGTSWLAFLDYQDGTKDFSEGPGQALAEGIYQRNFNADVDALYRLAQRWIQNRYLEKVHSSTPPEVNHSDSTEAGLEPKQLVINTKHDDDSHKPGLKL